MPEAVRCDLQEDHGLQCTFSAVAGALLSVVTLTKLPGYPHIADTAGMASRLAQQLALLLMAAALFLTC